MLEFSEEKVKTLNELSNYMNIINEMKTKLKIDESKYIEIKEKIERGIEKVKNEKFHVAFFGAFSEGKSTILSILMKSLDIPIAPDPTTDKVQEYLYEDYFVVDTPGLFSKDFEVHDEITKKYISEADVLIYVVDAVNPIKESHLDTIKWLMKDLNKINSTIIVINKMDTTLNDLENDREFQEKCQTKTNEVKKVLQSELGIENFGNIVCISADPYNLGLKSWFEKEEEYKKLSRIENLEKALDYFVQNAKERLQKESELSIIKDLVFRISETVEKIKNDILNSLEVLNAKYTELENRKKMLDNDINVTSNILFEELKNLKEDLINKVDNCKDFDDLKNFLSSEIGDNCYILERKIKSIFAKQLGNLNERKIEVLKSYDGIIKDYDGVLNILNDKEIMLYLQSAGKSASESLQKIKNTHILQARDLVKKYTGISYKFKPRGAIELADTMGKVGKILGEVFGAITFLTTVKHFLDKKKFNENKEKIKKLLTDIFNEFFVKCEKENIMDIIDYKALEEPEKILELEYKISELNALVPYIDQYQERLKI
jgi:hypothetical protein